MINYNIKEIVYFIKIRNWKKKFVKIGMSLVNFKVLFKNIRIKYTIKRIWLINIKEVFKNKFNYKNKL
jgi:hypothetical protein